MTTDATHNIDPSPPRQSLDKPSGRGPSGRGLDPAARDDAGSRRDAEPTDEELNVAFTFSSRDAEESLRSFHETLDELWANTVAIQMEQMERTVQQIGLRYSLPAWLPDRLAWWLTGRWAERLPTLGRRRVGRARQDHEH